MSGEVFYTFDSLVLPVTIGASYANVVSGNAVTSVVNDDLALSIEAALPSVAGIDASLSYTYHFYPEDPGNILWASSHGEVGLHLSRDLDVAVLKFDLFYNSDLPNAWNVALPTMPNDDRGAWFWDLGLEKSIDVLGHGLVLACGVAYADNYWGTAPNAQTGGRSSGWNHYYLRASLPIQLNCRTILTPYLGYVSAPDSWLLDGAPDWTRASGQSDVFHGGVNLSVSF